MLARDWYYNQRRQLGLDSAVASIYDRHDDSDLRARAALTMLGVQKGWRLADIGCGNGVLACEGALVGGEGGAIDISPARLGVGPAGPLGGARGARHSTFPRGGGRSQPPRRAPAGSRSAPSRPAC